MGAKIKLIATSKVTEKGTWAMVAPMLVESAEMLACVDGVMNAVFVKSNTLGDSMYYGSGAGSLPTASAVVADVVEMAQKLHEPIKQEYEAQPLDMLATDDVEHAFFVRTTASKQEVENVFGSVSFIELEGLNEIGFVSEVLTESQFQTKKDQLGNVVSFIRKA